jgi:ABC-type phosphate transport system permease subunit
MSMLNSHGVMPTSASAAGSGTAVSVSSTTHGVLATSLFALGVTLLVLTAIFAVAAIRGLLPRRTERTGSP